jgi:tight adherence protein B
MWTWLLIAFLVILAAELLSVSLGWRWVEARHVARVTEIFRAASGKPAREKAAILRSQQAEQALPEIAVVRFVHAALRKKIEQAGRDWTPGSVVLAMLTLGIVGAFAGMAFPSLGARWLTILVLACGFGALPYVWLVMARRRRLAAFEEQFPEALDFLSRSMKSGHAFSISLEMLADESIDPTSQEFRRVFHEQNLGAPLDVALKNLAARVPLVDVKFFVSAVLVQRETGGNLSEILLQLAYVIRERFQLKAQVRAISAHGRLTGIVLSLMPIALVFSLLLVAPGYLEGMVRDPLGKYLIGGVIFGQLMGYFFIHRIVNIKV